jgi:hypothetical protein
LLELAAKGVGGCFHVVDQELLVDVFRRGIAADHLSHGARILAAAQDRPLEGRRVEHQAANAVIGDHLPQDAAGQHRALDLVEPNALAGLLQSYQGRGLWHEVVPLIRTA